MDDLTNIAIWFVMALFMINVTFAWLAVVDGPLALQVAPSSPLANMHSCSQALADGHEGASALGADVMNSYTCGINPLFALVGGWQVALQNIFSGGIFDVPLNPNAVAGDLSSSIGSLYSTFLMPLFLILQALAIIDIAYRVAIALSSVGSALLSAGGAIANGIFSLIGGFL